MTTDSIAQLHAIADYLRGLDNHEDADYLLSLAASLRAENKILKASLVAAEERVAQLEGDLAQEAASLEAQEPVAWLWMRLGEARPVAASLVHRTGAIPLYLAPQPLPGANSDE